MKEIIWRYLTDILNQMDDFQESLLKIGKKILTFFNEFFIKIVQLFILFDV